MDANFGFLARHLLLTELHGSAVDINGGIAVLIDGAGGGPADGGTVGPADGGTGGPDVGGTGGPACLWHGLWEHARFGNVEAYIVEAQKRAEQAETAFAGVVTLARHGEKPWDELAEALFVYGLSEVAGPDSVLVLDHPPHPKPRGLRFLPLSESPGFSAMTCGAVETSAELIGPAWPDPQVTCAMLDIEVAWHDTTPIGAVGTYSTDLAERIALLWIEPAWREKEMAQALIEHVSQRAQASGKLLVTAWAKKTGLLRFAFNESGFSEQVTARYFKAS